MAKRKNKKNDWLLPALIIVSMIVVASNWDNIFESEDLQATGDFTEAGGILEEAFTERLPAEIETKAIEGPISWIYNNPLTFLIILGVLFWMYYAFDDSR